MEEPPLSEFEVIRFLENKGGRCTNYELVSNFRGILNDPRHQAEARLRFKDIINRVAAVAEYQNVKYIELKKEYVRNGNSPKQGEDPPNYGHSSLPFDPSATSGYSSPFSQNFQPYWRYRLSTNTQLPLQSKKLELETVLHSSQPKSLNRSISESILPDDRLQQSRIPAVPFRNKRGPTLTTDTYGRHSHSLSGDHLSTESLPYESGRHSRSLSREENTSHGHASMESWHSEANRTPHLQYEPDVTSSGYLSTESWPSETSRRSHSLSGYENASSGRLSTSGSWSSESSRQPHSLNGSEITSSGRLSTESWLSEPSRHSRPLCREENLSSGNASTESWLHESGRQNYSKRAPNMASPGHFPSETRASNELSRHSLTSLREEKTSPGNCSTQSWSGEFIPPRESFSRCSSSQNCQPNQNSITTSPRPTFNLPNSSPQYTYDDLNEPIYENYGSVKRLSDSHYHDNSPMNPKTNTDRSYQPTKHHLKDGRGQLPSKTTQIEDHSSPPNSNRRFSNAGNESTIEDDVLLDPNYLRSVSKQCFSNNKTSSNNKEKIDRHSTNPSRNDVCNNNRTSLVKGTSSSMLEDNIQRPYLLPKNDVAEDGEIPPQPPERRRKSLDKCNNRPPDSSPCFTNEEKPVVTVAKEAKISGKVKDKVQQFDEMGKKQKRISTHSGSGKENRVTLEKSNMEDDISISVLDPKLKKEWFVKASQCDYHALVSLLKKEPKLAALKDITSGFTALHWAAKHGDANVVKLIAGSYKINPNIRSNGGYTPLHLSSLYRHDMIGHLLIHTYGADPSIRDYYGKKAEQYPDNYIRKVAGSNNNAERRPIKQRPLVVKQTSSSNSFMRIGSLNLRKARKSTVFASVRGNNRNRNNHSELRFGNVDSTRKRNSKKENLYSERNCIEEDADFGFPLKKQDCT